MRNTTFSRLALVGLAVVSSVAFAANSVSGELRMDATFQTKQETVSGASAPNETRPADKLDVSRARLDFKGDIFKNWDYTVRVENRANAYWNQQIDYLANIVEPARKTEVTQAYATFTGLDFATINMGQVQSTDISMEHFNQTGIAYHPVGTILGYAGNHAGVTLEGQKAAFGYSFGLWSQTDSRELESFTTITIGDAFAYGDVSGENGKVDAAIEPANYNNKNLRLGYATRLAFAPVNKEGRAYGIGLGYSKAPLNTTLVVATAGEAGATGAGSLGLASFKDLASWKVDLTGIFGAIQVNAGYTNQTMALDLSNEVLNTGADTVAESTAFTADGKANAYYVEAGYLAMGKGYAFDAAKSAISGVTLADGKCGLELAIRYGTETFTNALALASTVGVADFDATKVTTTVNTNADNQNYVLMAVNNVGGVTAVDGTCFETKKDGFALNANYYLADNAVIKAEFEQDSYSYKKSGAASWTDSTDFKTVGNFRLRAEFSF